MPRAAKAIAGSGVVVDDDVPTPIGRFAVVGKLATLRETLRGMKPGESFLWPTSWLPHQAAAQLNVKITTRKVTGSGYRVWLL